MPDFNDAQTIAHLATQATPVENLEDGVYAVNDRYTVHDLRDHNDRRQPHPPRATGTTTVNDAAGFVALVNKHGGPHTEVYGDPTDGRMVAVLNAGAGDGNVAGWGDHRVSLHPRITPDWHAWSQRNGTMQGQVDFAEFVEDHLTNFVTPPGADMLELAQTIQAHTGVEFRSSNRVKSGETQILYRESTEASAGTTGQIVIPDTFDIALKPYVGSAAYRVTARFRYRINTGRLTLGYRLNRPEDVLQTVYDETVEFVTENTGRPVWIGHP